MPREYRHIKQYENELLDLRNQGLTYKETADRMGFSKKQIKAHNYKYNKFPMRPLNWKTPIDYIKAFTIDGEIL